MKSGNRVDLARLAAGLTSLLFSATSSLPAQPEAVKSYYVYACAESEDEVAIVRYGPSGASVVKVVPVGSFPTEIEGPHGINVAPDGRHWYVTLAHGKPFGTVHKYETGSNLWLADVRLGMYPATLDISATTGLLYAVNFNLHGKMSPSTISVVDTQNMIEVKQIKTGVMPHGSRLNPAGDRHYSVNMMNDEVVEVDALAFAVLRRLQLPGGKQQEDGSHSPHQPTVRPTWVTPPTRDGQVYVTGNKSDQIFEVDLDRWSISRTFSKTGTGPYNLAVAASGRTLVVTYKKESAVGFWDLEAGRETARIKTIRRMPHGVVISPDGEYAFVTVEGVGGEPGSVEVYHLLTRQRVGVAEIGKQAGGIAFWKTEG